MNIREKLLNEIVEPDFCIGCGVCAGICPESALEIRFNKFGEYKAFATKNRCIDCGLCIKVCPFENGNPNEDDIGKIKFCEIPGIQHRIETGYYLDSYVGYASDEKLRWNGASGGCTTALLIALLEKNIIDSVITVKHNNNPEKLFKYSICSSIEEIKSCSKSAYYPVELSEVLKKIRKENKKYAVVGLPCFIKAIELVKLADKNLAKKIIFTVGLVCGQLKSKNYTKYLVEKSGLSGRIEEVCFRGKSYDHPASDFFFSAKNDDQMTKKLYWIKDSVYFPWVNRWFTPNSCNYCDDVFAECADVVFMDAWLPEYQDDPKGTNIILFRNKFLQNLIMNEEKLLKTIPIQIDRVIESQKGVIDLKRIDLMIRVNNITKKKWNYPKKRKFHLKHINNDCFDKTILTLQDKIQFKSKIYYENYNIRKLEIILNFYKTVIRIIRKFSRLRRIIKR